MEAKKGRKEERKEIKGSKEEWNKGREKYSMGEMKQGSKEVRGEMGKENIEGKVEDGNEVMI